MIKTHPARPNHMAYLLLYDKQDFEPRMYARAWNLVCTCLNLCLEKGYLYPSRHYWKRVYVLVAKEREAIFKTILDNYRAAGLELSFQRRLLDYPGHDADSLRRELRLQGLYEPFADVAHRESLEQLEGLEARLAVAKAVETQSVAALGLTSGLDTMIESARRENNDKSRKRGRPVLRQPPLG